MSSSWRFITRIISDVKNTMPAVTDTSSVTVAGATGGNISIESDEGLAWVMGDLDAAGNQGGGGEIRITGERVAVIEATIDAWFRLRIPPPWLSVELPSMVVSVTVIVPSL